MSKLMSSIERRTRLAGRNRLELLLFGFAQEQVFGINVFKVLEVMPLQKLNPLPNANECISGMFEYRGKVIPAINLGSALGYQGSEIEPDAFMIITEFNQSIQALIVNRLHRIINLSWESIVPPPDGIHHSSGSYITGVSKVGDDLIEIIDVERVISEVLPELYPEQSMIQNDLTLEQRRLKLLVVDDSIVGQKQITTVLDNLGLQYYCAFDGIEALSILQDVYSKGGQAYDELCLVISDIEMPRMDGYTLCKHIREHEALKHLKVILHTSLSGVFNKKLIQTVGADQYIPKYEPDVLASSVIGMLSKYQRTPFVGERDGL